MSKESSDRWWNSIVVPRTASGPYRLRFTTDEALRDYRRDMHCRTLADMTPAEIEAIEREYGAEVRTST